MKQRASAGKTLSNGIREGVKIKNFGKIVKFVKIHGSLGSNKVGKLPVLWIIRYDEMKSNVTTHNTTLKINLGHSLAHSKININMSSFS